MQHVQLFAPGSLLSELEPLVVFPRKPVVKADHVADPGDFRTVGPIMKFVRLVPMQNRMDGDTLVAGGLGFFGDVAWPILQTSAPSDELQELLPTARRKVKSKVLPLWACKLDGDTVDEAGGAEEKKDDGEPEPVEDDDPPAGGVEENRDEDDDPDDAACVPEDERVAEEESFQPFFTMPASSTEAVDISSSLTIELAFVNFLRKVCAAVHVLACTPILFHPAILSPPALYPAYLRGSKGGTSSSPHWFDRSRGETDSFPWRPWCEALDTDLPLLRQGLPRCRCWCHQWLSILQGPWVQGNRYTGMLGCAGWSA